MTSSRSEPQPTLSVRPPPAGGSALSSELPPLSALFLIDFDVRAGYTIAWKRAEDGIELEGLVEYKSLPSGLHTVDDDLIYFIHEGGYAGLSAFVNTPCEEEDARNARMIAVGILVPLSEGRLGRAWRHAEFLKDMAVNIANDRSQTELLETYWSKNRGQSPDGEGPSAETPLDPSLLSSQNERSKKGHNRSRSASDGAALVPPGHRLSSYHPAWSLNSLLDTFGPLIFPIQRAALLRKRILISCHTPVHEICNFVYDLSVLSNIPHPVAAILDPASTPSRLRPLFNIGVHDIGFLMEDAEAAKRRADGSDDVAEESGTGWIACTTDSILAMKDTLWDMLITMPPAHSSQAKEKAWPRVECPQGVPVKATQRDLRRFRALKSGLARLSAATPRPGTAGRSFSGSSSSIKHITGAFPAAHADSEDAMDKVVQPVTWTALAYSGFIWWASAGEQGHNDEQEEAALDAALLADLAPSPRTTGQSVHSRAAAHTDDLDESMSSLTNRRSLGNEDEAKTELAIIAYFHRLTTQIFSVMAELVDSNEADNYEPYGDEGDGDEPRISAGGGGRRFTDEADEGESSPLRSDENEAQPVQVDSHAVESMGLDVWDAHDAEFVKETMTLYFAREARVEGKGVEVCGMRVC